MEHTSIISHHAQNEFSKSLLCLSDNKTVREMRKLIFNLETAILSMPEAKLAKDFDTRHHFEDGIYMRELVIPKYTLLTGKIHKFPHLNILSKGKLTVWTEDGVKTLSASSVIKSQSGMKRVGYAHEESVWITVHSNIENERDISKIEQRLFSDSFDEAYSDSERTFKDAVHLLGFTEEEVKTASENTEDQVLFSLDGFGVMIRDSIVHGKGVFATRLIKKGSYICSARINGRRTPIGRFCNHSGNPNGKMVLKENGDVELFALTDIETGEEIMNDYYYSYRDTVENYKNSKGQLCQQ